MEHGGRDQSPIATPGLHRLIAAAGLAAAWVLAGAAPAGAGIDSGPLLGGWAPSSTYGSTGSGFTPSVWADGRGLGFAIGGTLDLALGSGGESGARLPTARHLQLEASGASHRIRGPDLSAGAVSARLHLDRPARGLWLLGSGFTSDAAGSPMLPLLGAGGWMRRGPFLLTTQIVQLLRPVRVGQSPPPATAPPPDSGNGVLDREHWPVPPTEEDIRVLTGAESSIAWGYRRFELQSRLGVAVGNHHRPMRWGELRAGYSVRPGVFLFAMARDVHEVPDVLEPLRETHAAFGIQLAPPGAGEGASWREPPAAPPAFVVERLGGGRYRVTLRVPARTVELSSDATGWRPVVARRTGADRWEAELSMAPGAHRIALRIDGGAWQAPAGLPIAIDEFGGEVGVVVVDG